MNPQLCFSPSLTLQRVFDQTEYFNSQDKKVPEIHNIINSAKNSFIDLHIKKLPIYLRRGHCLENNSVKHGPQGLHNVGRHQIRDMVF